MFRWFRQGWRQFLRPRGGFSATIDSACPFPATRLAESLPDLAAELEKLLTKSGEPKLASQIQRAYLIERCRCKDDFCSTFYVLPKPVGSYGPHHRTIALDPKQGMINVDVVNGQIACVEVLYRDDVQSKLNALLPFEAKYDPARAL